MTIININPSVADNPNRIPAVTPKTHRASVAVSDWTLLEYIVMLGNAEEESISKRHNVIHLWRNLYFANWQINESMSPTNANRTTTETCKYVRSKEIVNVHDAINVSCGLLTWRDIHGSYYFCGVVHPLGPGVDAICKGTMYCIE